MEGGAALTPRNAGTPTICTTRAKGGLINAKVIAASIVPGVEGDQLPGHDGCRVRLLSRGKHGQQKIDVEDGVCCLRSTTADSLAQFQG